MYHPIVKERVLPGRLEELRTNCNSIRAILKSQAPKSPGIGKVHRKPLANLKCLSEKRQFELAAQLGVEPGDA